MFSPTYLFITWENNKWVKCSWAIRDHLQLLLVVFFCFFFCGINIEKKIMKIKNNIRKLSKEHLDRFEMNLMIMKYQNGL